MIEPFAGTATTKPLARATAVSPASPARTPASASASRRTSIDPGLRPVSRCRGEAVKSRQPPGVELAMHRVEQHTSGTRGVGSTDAGAGGCTPGRTASRHTTAAASAHNSGHPWGRVPGTTAPRAAAHGLVRTAARTQRPARGSPANRLAASRPRSEIHTRRTAPEPAGRCGIGGDHSSLRRGPVGGPGGQRGPQPGGRWVPASGAAIAVGLELAISPSPAGTNRERTPAAAPPGSARRGR